jgi:hypothetical protein
MSRSLMSRNCFRPLMGTVSHALNINTTIDTTVIKTMFLFIVSLFAIRHSPLLGRTAVRPYADVTERRTSHLAPRTSHLAPRHSLRLTPNPSPEERGAGQLWRIDVKLLYRLCFGTIAFIQKNKLRCHSPLAIRHSPFAIRHSPLAICHSPLVTVSPPSTPSPTTPCTSVPALHTCHSSQHTCP